ncbi:chitobiase/beta-hexosaminidase C-terminal domain-containing protein [Flavonifractor sp. HCP28S3_F3]|uniref:chitobiase/beta-hexosaminidase C-terminal domain-containing protein n=1 Tax=Flavonifractor sp. HCP28S3_F3 TaxID=3438939 RepID=UPI003F88F2E3
MKKLVSLILCLAMAMAWLPAGSPFATAADSPFDGGSGTEEDPYLVSTPEQLKVVKDYSGSHFLQTNDIDLSDVSYMPSQSIAGSGVYDGGGNCITGYKGSSALFSSNSGTIKNLGMKNSQITDTSRPYGQHLTYTVGGLVETNDGTIHSCYVDNMYMFVSISMKASHSFASLTLDVGGMVGINRGTISCCYITGSIYGYGTCEKYNIAGAEASASVNVGGISGKNESSGTIHNCYSTTAVTGASTSALCDLNRGSVTDSYYSEGSGTGTRISDAEIKSSAFAATLDGNCSDCSWELGISSEGTAQVVQAMQNLTVSANPPSGTYHMPVTVGITSDRAPGSDQLEYSIDGETEGWQACDGSIRLNQGAVVRVRAADEDKPNSYRVSTFRYKTAKYPVEASPAPGTYITVPQTITLTTQTPGAKIYYTLDGTTPTEDSFSGSFVIFKNTTVTAAAKVGDEWGDPLSFTYKISPKITPDKLEGDYTEPFTVRLTSSVPQYDIYYTVDGSSDPTVNGTKYDPDQGIEIYKTTTLRVASTFEEEWSDITTFQYDFPEPVITPSVEEGEYKDVVHLTLTCDTPYLTLSYYAPGLTAMETPYEPGDTIDIYKSAELTVYAKHNGQIAAEKNWTYTLPEPEITADPGAGAYSEIQTITLSCNIPSYQLYYTLDGGDPATEGVLYSEPFELDHSATLKVCAKYGKHEVKTDSFSYNLSAVPSVTADPAAGDITAPEDIELTAPNKFYTIYYTTDGSDPKTSPTRSSGVGEVQIHIEDPEPITIRAVPELNGTYGTTSTFRYTFSSQKLAMEKTKLEKRTDYEITFNVTNTLPKDKTVDLYAAAYQNGKMLGSAVESMALSSGTEKKSVTMHYPSIDQLPADAQIKVFCLDSVTRQPYCEPLTYEVSEAKVFQELASISVSPNPIVGQVGETVARPTVTAHYTNGKPDAVVTYNITIKPDYDVVLVSYPSQNLLIKKEGTGSITVSYSEGGITKSVEVPVTGVAPVVNLGFLANPTADPLPEDAIPISSAQELAALNDTSDGANTAGKTYYLTNDIQLTGEWEPIYGFQGTLDGRGHKISGLYISASSKEQLAGLFASAYDAVIKNLGVEIDPRGVSAYDDTAGGDVAYAAGLVGDSRNTDFINCYTTGGPVSANGAAPYAGGLVGYLMNKPENQVTNCFSNCQVSAESSRATASNICMAGGLIGKVESGNGYKSTAISRCYATGNVSVNYPGGSSGSSGTQVGGLLGSGSRLKISNCFALGNVTARKAITSTNSSVFAGGLGGWLLETTLGQCYAAGDVSGGADSYVGGLTARVVISFDCYRVDQSVVGTTYSNDGTSVSVPATQESFPKFEFTTTWKITEDAFQGLPHLQYQG